MTEDLQLLDNMINSENKTDNILEKNNQEYESNNTPEKKLNLFEKEQKKVSIGSKKNDNEIQKNDDENNNKKNENSKNNNDNINNEKKIKNAENNIILENIISSNISPTEDKEKNDIINNDYNNNNYATPIKEEKPLIGNETYNISCNAVNTTDEIKNNNKYINFEQKSASNGKNSKEDINNINLSENNNLTSSKIVKDNQESNSEINSEQKSIKTEKKQAKNKKPISNYNKKKSIDNILNNRNVSETVYYQYNSLYINKQFINNNKKNNNKKKQGTANKNKSIEAQKQIDTKNKQNDKFSTTYKRFIEEQKKKKEKIDEIKKTNEEKEKNLCYNKPKINKKSQELASKNKGDFYSRQIKLMDEKKKRDALLKEKIRKKELEEINKNNILLKPNKERKKLDRKKSMDDAIKNIYEWDEKRKEKLNDKIKTKEKNVKMNLKSKPQINKNSYLITVNRNPNKIFNRLYIDDINKRKQRKELLEHIYTPSFQPNLIKSKNNHKKRKRYLSSYKNNRVNTMSSNTIRSNFKSEAEECSEEEEDSDYIHDDEEICDLIRAHVFKKVKNNVRYNTCENLQIKKSESMKDYILNKDEVQNSGLNKYFSPNPSKKNKIKIKKNNEYLMSENKNRNRSGYL